MSLTPQPSAPQMTDVLVIGAGPAGLAVGALLAQTGRSFLMLDRADAVGSRWRQHYERLHLHTPRRHSHLPLLDMPAHYPRYPSRQQVVNYLESYKQHFQLQRQLRLGERVVEAAQDERGAWRVSTDAGKTYRSRALVVATGHNDLPFLPHWPGMEEYTGRMLHSSQYRSGRDFAGQRVLVVGLGNSGGEIAIDLHEHGARPTVAVRSPVNVIPKEVLGISYLDLALWQQKLPPALADALSRPSTDLLLGDLTRFGLRRPPDGPFTQLHETGRVPLINIGTVELIRAGQLAVRPGLERFTPDGVTFEAGLHEPFDAVILATGFRPGVTRWLGVSPQLLSALPQWSGKPTPVPGLYFCGFYVSPTGMLREINLEARRIVRHLHFRALTPSQG